jgi:hypothetical protein
MNSSFKKETATSSERSQHSSRNSSLCTSTDKRNNRPNVTPKNNEIDQVTNGEESIENIHNYCQNYIINDSKNIINVENHQKNDAIKYLNQQYQFNANYFDMGNNHFPQPHIHQNYHQNSHQRLAPFSYTNEMYHPSYQDLIYSNRIAPLKVCNYFYNNIEF